MVKADVNADRLAIGVRASGLDQFAAVSRVSGLDCRPMPRGLGFLSLKRGNGNAP